MSKTDYEKLIELDSQSPQNLSSPEYLRISADQVKKFDTIIKDNVSVTNTKLWLRFLNGIHAMQGKDERFLNIIFNKMEQGEIKYRIIPNEYDNKIWTSWSKGESLENEYAGHNRIYRNRMRALASGYEKYSEIEALYERCYQKKIFLLDLAWTSEDASEKIIIFHQSEMSWTKRHIVAKKLIGKNNFSSSKDIKEIVHAINLENEFLKASYYCTDVIRTPINENEPKIACPENVIFLDTPMEYNSFKHIAIISNYLTFEAETNTQVHYDADRSNRLYWPDVEEKLKKIMLSLQKNIEHSNEQIITNPVNTRVEKNNFLYKKYQTVDASWQEAKKQAESSVTLEMNDLAKPVEFTEQPKKIDSNQNISTIEEELKKDQTSRQDEPAAQWRLNKKQHVFFQNKQETDDITTNLKHIQKPSVTMRRY